MSDLARVLAPAKVNLVLHVLGRRPDGYHELATIFQAIDLCDEVCVELTREGVELEVEGVEHLGPPHENLAHRAATRLLSELAPGRGARVRLTKRIPIGAGLGGGSSDAAAVLLCLADLLGGCEPERLRTVGAELGSDVPFFLGESPLARGRGRGELLTPLVPLPPAYLVLVSPYVHVSTAAAYAALAEVRAGLVPVVDDAEVMAPTTWQEVESMAHNDFQPVISASHWEIRRALDALTAAGASTVMMTGSGSTCFGVFPERSVAEEVANSLGDRLGWPCRATRTLSVLPEVERG